MYKIKVFTLGIFLLSCVVLQTAMGDIRTKAQVITYLEANIEYPLAKEVHPKVLEKLVELFKKQAIESGDITRYGKYLSGFQNIKSVFYEIVGMVKLSDSAILIGEYFILSYGTDPLQKYGRHLHSLDKDQRSKIGIIVWNQKSTGVNRRSNVKKYLRELQLFDNEIDLKTFVDDLFIAYIHSRLWFEEKQVRLGKSLISSHEYFRGNLRLSNTLSFFPHEKTKFVSAFRELEDAGFIEIMDAQDPVARNGIQHTLARMPLRNGEIVIIPVLTLLSPIRQGLKARKDLQFLSIIYPHFKEGVRTKNWKNFATKMEQRGHGDLINEAQRVAYIRFLPPWTIPVSKTVNRGY